ncbi:MAG: SDR family oxidoreductase [bacterium]
MIVVTGASGHVGNNLIRELNRRGIKPRALIHREESADKSLKGLDFEPVKGDVTNLESMVEAFKGARLVYHCAAWISITPGMYKKLKTVNVDGTLNVLEACRKNNVKKIVYVSSIEALGDPGDGVLATEKMGFNPDKAMLEYGVTKAEAALLVQEAVKNGMDIVTVCPVGIIGPHDYKPSQMGNMMLDFYRKKLPAYPNYGGFDWVDVRDVVEGIILAGKKGKSGEAYLLTNGHTTSKEMMKILEKTTGGKMPKIALPYWLLSTAGFFAEFFYKATGKEAVITRDSAKILKSNLCASSEKAKRELGYNPRPLEESFKDHFEWLVDYYCNGGKKDGKKM